MVIARDVGDAIRWRSTTREAFSTLLDHDYAVKTFFRETATGQCFYGLEGQIG